MGRRQPDPWLSSTVGRPRRRSGEFGEGLLWLVVLDARYALERGDLAEARAQAEHGLAMAERTSRVWQIPGLIQIMAAVELASGRPEVAHGRLEWLRDCLTASGFGPAGQAKGERVVARHRRR